MDVVGSEIGQKMRSAIKAKLTELGCYVDDELPDYVMVMVANKRTRSQMEDDLQLFLGDNTELFVNWLHQVLKKLQEVTVTAPVKGTETDISKERSQSKERRSKDKKVKDKSRKSDEKKSKKKDKSKSHHHKKMEKKAHKSKKKSKQLELIRPNIPPLLMNMEKDSEPSITDVFAGQILKNHGVILDEPKEQLSVIEKKPIVEEIKRPIRPIIDPASIPSQSEPSQLEESSIAPETPSTIPNVSSFTREQHLKEMDMIEDKMQGLKQKLAEQLEAMSEEDDEDFLNIRTEADELMNDFAEDVFQEVTQQTVTATPPLKPKTPPPLPKQIVPAEPQKNPIETLPQIELKLPKRPVRERLGTREEVKKVSEPKKMETEKRTESPERFTPEREPEPRPSLKSIKNRLGGSIEPQRKSSTSDDISSEKCETSSKKLTSRVSVLERAPCASVVRVRPRPRVPAPASSLLMKAVAEAHKSLLNAPPKIEPDLHKVKRALVRPMRRTVEPQKIIIQVPADSLPTQTESETEADRHGDSISLGMDSDDDKSFKGPSDTEKEEYIPSSITKKITNTEYVPSRRHEYRTTSRKDDSLVIETLNIHNPTVDKDRKTQFIVTMDGYDPNAFLAKKLQNEGILNDDDDLKPKEVKDKKQENTKDKQEEKKAEESPETSNVQKKRLSNESEESDTQVIIKAEKVEPETVVTKMKEDAPQGKKRKGSPIVFDVGKREREPERTRVRTESTSSDNQVIVTTTTNTHKYDSVPPLSQAEHKLEWCLAFPWCGRGEACPFAHPRCKFLAACTRRTCTYSHSPTAPLAPPRAARPQHRPHLLLAPPPHALASHVVPAANYKTISSVAVPNMCKYFPGCANPTCHYYHPKPCRYGKNCANKLECNFYHSDVPSKWRYTV